MELENVKAGDVLVYNCGVNNIPSQLVTVVRTTKTKIVIERNGVEEGWNRKGQLLGARCSDPWYIQSLRPLRDDSERQEINNAVRKFNLAKKLTRVNWNIHSLSILEKVWEILANENRKKSLDELTEQAH